MGNLIMKEAPPPPPPIILVPPLFDFPPLAARTRMLESSYDVLFGKLALKSLFDDYFEEAGRLTTRILLKPIDDPLVDLVTTVSGPLGKAESEDDKIVGDSFFRWQSDVDDPHTFIDLFVSNSHRIFQIRSSTYYPRFGFGAFGIVPILLKKKRELEDYGVIGLRYGSENLSAGATFLPLSVKEELPRSAWLVSKIGRLTVGLQYVPKYGSKDYAKYKNLRNWSAAIGYGVGSGSPLSPSFNFGLELAHNSQFIASFYQHVVVQRQVKNPFEEKEILGITNYINFGFELQTRVDDTKRPNHTTDSSFQVAASWQANKNFLLKGKVGALSSSLALAFKSWWRPSFTFNITATRDHKSGDVGYGFGIRVENLREASYQRADPNYVMVTPSKEHLAEGYVMGKRPMLQSKVDAGNFENVPRELRPAGKIL